MANDDAFVRHLCESRSMLLLQSVAEKLGPERCRAALGALWRGADPLYAAVSVLPRTAAPEYSDAGRVWSAAALRFSPAEAWEFRDASVPPGSDDFVPRVVAVDVGGKQLAIVEPGDEEMALVRHAALVDALEAVAGDYRYGGDDGE